jgi:hypothetical protein
MTESGAARMERENSATRLSDHFHKVRLTSLILSMSLLFASIHGNTLKLPLLDLTVATGEGPFLLVSLSIASAVAFAHFLTLWRAEAREVDSQSQDAMTFQSSVQTLIGEAQSLQQRIEDRSSELYKFARNIDEGGRVPRPVQTVEWDAFHRKLRGALEELTDDLSEKIYNVGVVAAQNITAAGIQEENALHDQAIQDENLYALRERLSLDDFEIVLKEIRARRLEEQSRANGVVGFVFDNQKRVLESFRSDAHDKLFTDAEFSSALMGVMSENNLMLDQFVRTNEKASSDFSELSTEVQKQTVKLSSALRALRRSSRLTQIQIRGFDLAIPTIAFGIAEAHSIGSLFTGFIPSAPAMFGAIQPYIKAGGWLATTVVCLVFGGAIASLSGIRSWSDLRRIFRPD